MRRIALAIGSAVLGACVPAQDTGTPQYGSVAVSLTTSATRIDLPDGWSFSLEHLFLVPSVGLASAADFGGIPARKRSCSTLDPDGNGSTLVDLVAGVTFDINKVDPNGGCTVVQIQPTPVRGLDLASDPRVSDADRTQYAANAGQTFPALWVKGRAVRGATSERVDLFLGGGSPTMLAPPRALDVPFFLCAPTMAGAPVPLGIPATRQTLHFGLDLARLFPGNPPSFDPLARSDTDGDGVVTADELDACLAETIAFQIGTAWRLDPDAGLCEPPAGVGPLPSDPGCADAGPDGTD